MKFYTKLAALFIVISATACTSTGNKGASKTTVNSDGKICKMEKATGSNIRKKVCRTPEQIALAERAAKEQRERGTFKRNAGVYNPHDG